MSESATLDSHTGLSSKWLFKIGPLAYSKDLVFVFRQNLETSATIRRPIPEAGQQDSGRAAVLVYKIRFD